MDHRIKALIAASLLSLTGVASAFYAEASPPQGWAPAPAGSGAPGGVTGTKVAVNASFANGSVKVPVSLNAGGRRVQYLATLPYAQTASRYAAAAIMRHPYIRTAAAVASWLGVAGLVYDEISGLWNSPDADYVISDGFTYYLDQDSSITGNSYASIRDYAVRNCADLFSFNWDRVQNCEIVNDYVSNWQFSVTYKDNFNKVWTETRFASASRKRSECPAGWYVTPAGCVQNPPPKTITEEEAIEELTRHPMPEEIPKLVPEPLPVELPSFPPFFVPSSEPRVNPNYDPALPASPDNAPYYQPGVEVKPAPTASSPWQVSITPQNQPVVDPTQVGSETRPLPDGSGGGSGGGSETKPPEAADDFCARNPGVIACQTLEHEDDDTTLPEKAIEFEFDLISGFSGSATCPAFPNVGDMLGGKQISWQPFCDTLAKLRNLLLAFAWASAAFIILGYGRGD